MDLAQRPAPVMAEAPLASAPTFCHAFQRTVAALADQVAIRSADSAAAITWRRYGEDVRAVATGLAALDVQPGDTIALMMRNRPEFHVADAAAMHLGAIPFSIYNTSAAGQISQILLNARSRIVVCEEQFVGRLRDACRDTAVEHLVVVDAKRAGGTSSLRELRELSPAARFDFDARWRAVKAHDVLTLIYTSGTTGPPKGVELTHASLLFELRALSRVFPLPDAGGSVVSYLPMAHIAERMVSHYMPMPLGVAVTTCPDAGEVFDVVATAHPSWFFAVPRMWEKLKAAIEARLGALPAAEREPARRSLEASLRVVRARQAGTAPLPADAARALRGEETVYARVRGELGLDRLDAVLVGSAPSRRDVLEFFHAIGVPICEMWGMTETSVAVTANTPAVNRVGTVGRPLPGIDVATAEDGEILVRGPLLMRGYRDDPVRTAEAIDPDGWLHTGDLGTFDADGFLQIVGRKKELIISSGGKNMSPANIEAAIKAACPLAGQVVAVGDGRPYVAALVTLDPVAAVAFAAAQGIEGRDLAGIAAHPAVQAAVAAGVERGNADLSRVEQVKRFRVLGADWEPGGEELTPTMKLKRAAIAARYAAEIAALYE